MEYEVRKLPKKTIIWIVVMIAIAICIFFVLKTLKEQKMTEVIAPLGYPDVKNMQVINKLSVEDRKTRYKSTVYKVRFFDNKQNKTCIGFIHFSKNNKHSTDFDCK